MAKRRAIKHEELEETGFLENEELAEQTEGETFAEAAGTPANVHAKKLAKAGSKAKQDEEPRAHFYTMKGAEKVVKIVVKHRGAFEIYVGNMRRHGASLKGLIKLWQKEGVWAEAHQRKEQIEKLRAGLSAPKKR